MCVRDFSIYVFTKSGKNAAESFTKKNMKFSILIFLLLNCIAQIPAQEKCDLQNAPALLDLNLKMTTEQARNTNGRKLKIKNENEGEYVFFENYIDKKNKGNLRGLKAIYLRFYENKLYQIELFYKTEYKWRDLSEFIGDYSAQNSFPINLWEIEYGYAKANCNDFSLKADYILNPHIQLTDEEIFKQVQAKREAEKNDER